MLTNLPALEAKPSTSSRPHPPSPACSASHRHIAPSNRPAPASPSAPLVHPPVSTTFTLARRALRSTAAQRRGSLARRGLAGRIPSMRGSRDRMPCTRRTCVWGWNWAWSTVRVGCLGLGSLLEASSDGCDYVTEVVVESKALGRAWFSCPWEEIGRTL